MFIVNGIIIWWFLHLCVIYTQAQKDAIVAELELFEIDKKYDTKFIDWNTLRMTRVSRNNFVVNGTVIVNFNLNNHQAINLQIYSYDAKQKMRGLLVFNVDQKICEFIEKDKQVYPGLQDVSNLPEPGTCPVPKGEYHIKNYELKIDFLSSDIPDGDYNILVKLKNGFNTVAGLEIFIKISHET
ncbi:chemosensory protein A 7a [Musca autumnalis]|uniref:chemosensory protein A 7a n=1 Tax=Musca autumnalis TaxID=221902 RepID=UPI003CF46F8D